MQLIAFALPRVADVADAGELEVVDFPGGGGDGKAEVFQRLIHFLIKQPFRLQQIAIDRLFGGGLPGPKVVVRHRCCGVGLHHLGEVYFQQHHLVDEGERKLAPGRRIEFAAAHHEVGGSVFLMGALVGGYRPASDKGGKVYISIPIGGKDVLSASAIIRINLHARLIGIVGVVPAILSFVPQGLPVGVLPYQFAAFVGKHEKQVDIGYNVSFPAHVDPRCCRLR